MRKAVEFASSAAFYALTLGGQARYGYDRKACHIEGVRLIK